jgi:hypothetical protein
MIMMKEIYQLIASKGVEYVQNPEHRAQIIKVSFVVMMKLFTLVRNRFKKKGVNSNEHVECNCNSCKVWRAKLDDALHSHMGQMGDSDSVKSSRHRFFSSWIPSLLRKSQNHV